MDKTDRVKYLRIALLLVGLIFIFGIYLLTIIWPSGWSWHTGHSDYLQMPLGFVVFECKRQRNHTVDGSSPQPASKRGGGLRGPTPGQCCATSPLHQQILRRRNP